VYTSGGVESFYQPIPAQKCELRLPNGTVCSYEYGSGTAPSPTDTCGFTGDSNKPEGFCEFLVNITSKSLSGIYTLKSTMTDSTVREDTYHVYLRTGKKIQLIHICIILSSC
jgi:hypothetical protein